MKQFTTDEIGSLLETQLGQLITALADISLRLSRLEELAKEAELSRKQAIELAEKIFPSHPRETMPRSQLSDDNPIAHF